MSINWLKKISNKSQHDAFTDLNRLHDHLLLCFRRATDHHSNDGKVILQRLNLHGRFIAQAEFQLVNTDLRDPKITILYGNHLLLTAYARSSERDNEGNEKRLSRNTYWYSRDGINWEHKGFFATPFHWCWRLSWHDQHIFSLAYERKTENLYLYRGSDLATFKTHIPAVLSKTKHGLGYPNESDLCFVGTGKHSKAIAIVRRDADTFSTQLGKSAPPFEKWQWQDLPIYLASPRILAGNDSELIVAARYAHGELTHLTPQHRKMIEYFAYADERLEYSDDELKTGLFTLNTKTNQLCFKLPLPSADDNGYPGMVADEKGLWISYYSTAEMGKTQVYVAYISN